MKKEPQSFRFRADRRDDGIECNADVLYTDGTEEHYEGDEAIGALDGIRRGGKGDAASSEASGEPDAGEGSGSEGGEGNDGE